MSTVYIKDSEPAFFDNSNLNINDELKSILGKGLDALLGKKDSTETVTLETKPVQASTSPFMIGLISSVVAGFIVYLILKK